MALSKESLEEWRRCDEQRRALEQQARTLRDRCEQLAGEFEKELQGSGKASVIRHGFTLAWTTARASVAWADAFLRECGPEKAAALKAEAAAKATRKLSITVPQ